MTSITDISQRIKQNLDAKAPPLAGTAIASSIVSEVVSEVLDPNALMLRSTHLVQGDGQVLIEGEADILGFQGLRLSLGYTTVSQACFFVLQAPLPTFKPFAALKGFNSPVTNPTLVWHYGPLATTADDDSVIPPSSYVQFTGTLNLAGLKLPVIVRPPVSDGLWELREDFQLEPLSGLKPLVEWIGGAVQAPPLPPGLDALDGLAISGLSLSFDADRGRVSAAGLRISTTAPWKLVGDRLVIDQVSLSLGYAQGEEGTAKVTALAQGLLRVGEQALDVAVGTDSDRGVAFLQALADDFRLPSLNDLAKLVGEPKLFKALPSSLTQIQNFFLHEFSIEIDSKSLKLSSLRAELGCPEPVEFAKGTVFENVSLDLEITPGVAAPISVRLSALLEAGEYIPLQGRLKDDLEVDGAIPSLPLSQLAKKFIPGLPKEFPEIDLTDVQVHLTSGGSVHFTSSIEFDFHDLAAKLKIPLPDGLADIKLSTFSLQADFGKGNDATLKVCAEFPTALSFPEGSKNHIHLYSVELNWSSNEGIGGQLELGGTLKPATAVEITVPKFFLGYNAAKNWFGSAKVTAAIYGNEFTDFVAGVDAGKFSLSCELKRSAGKLLDVTNIAVCRVEKFSVSVGKAKGDDSESKWQFNVDGTGSIDVGPTAKPYVSTDFHIYVAQDELQLQAKNPAPISIALSSIAPKPNLELRFSDLSVQWDKSASEFFVGGVGTGALNNLPDIVRGQFFPEQLPTVDLKASTKGLEVTCDLSKNPLSPDVQIFHVGGKPVGPKIAINKLGIGFGDNPKIDSEIQISKLGDLNYVFGRKGNGDPKIRFLKDTCQVRLSLGKDPILQLQLESSPFMKFDFQKDADGRRFFVANLGGGLNKFKVYVPEMGYSDKGGWTGAAGMEILDPPIKIPLVPLKYVLSQLGAPPKVINAIPQSVPIDVVDINKHKTFRSVLEAALNSKPKVDKLYESSVAGPTLKEFNRVVWQTIRKGVKQMPSTFRDYASPPDIQKLEINLGAAPGGGWNGGLSVGDREPLKFMLPFVGGPVPELVGFSIKSFELGQATAGVATFKIDGAIDRFDLVTLVVAVLNSETKLLSKKQVDSLTNHLKLENVFGIAFSGFPVPIPILYDNISWDYKNWWGLEGASDWTFQLGKDTDIWATLGALMPFFSQKGYHLADPKNRSGDQLRLNLRVGPNYLKLPKYLGGSAIGPTKGTPTLPADVSVRWWLDACKFINPGYAIRSVPLPVRMGYKTITFGPLEVNAGWCMTTEKEFKEEIIGNKQAEEILSAIDVTKTLKHLPKSKAGVAYDKGFIVVLAGGAKLASILEYTAQFGIAVTSTGGFESRIFMEGGITNVVTLAIDGGIQVQPDGTTKIDGTCDLKVIDRSMIKIHGLITVTDHSLFVSCVLTLANTLDFGGKLYIGNDGVYIEGGFAWHYAARKKISQAAIRATFDANGMLIALHGKKIFGSKCTVGVYVNQHGMGALVSFDDVSGLQGAFLEELNNSFERAKQEVDKNKAALSQLIEKNIKKTKDFDDVRKGLPGILIDVKNKAINTVRDQAGRQYNRLSGANLIGVNMYYKEKVWNYKKHNKGARRKLQNEAVAQIRGFLKPIDSLVVRLNAIGSDKNKKSRIVKTQNAILQALDEGIALEKKRVTIKVWKIPVKTIIIKDYLPTPNPFDRLRKLRDLVRELPGEWANETAARNAIAESAAAQTEKVLGGIVDNIQHHVTEQIPQIKSITFDTPLISLSAKGAKVTVEVQLKRNQKPKSFTARVDLNNLPKSIPAVTAKFIDAIG